MKNRYFGDVYDYLKYGLVRQLTDFGTMSTAICWMLTEDDGGKDGKRIGYLGDPDRWRSLDPPVFDFLRRQVLERKSRTVRALERSRILPNCRFYSEILRDEPVQRKKYFEQFLKFSGRTGLVFFDPDNGLEVKSVGYGARTSSKYLFWNEVRSAFLASHSLLIYQHLPPKPRGPFVRRIAAGLLRVTDARTVYAFRTGKVAFLLLPGKANKSQFARRATAVGEKWSHLLTISVHHN